MSLQKFTANIDRCAFNSTRRSEPANGVKPFRTDFGATSPRCGISLTACRRHRKPGGPTTAFVYNLCFPGQYYDAESGTFYNYHRDYNPTLGQYLQSDPVGLAAGVNTYAYVAGNPLSRIDSLGLIWGDDWNMFQSWASGSAPPNTVYGPGTNQSNDMMQSQGVQNAINYFNKKNAGKCANQRAPVTNYDYSFGPKALWQAGTNSTQQFVGSYSVNVYPNSDDSVSVHVYNTTSLTSFLYGVYPNSWNPSNGSSFGNESQEYVGNVPDNGSNCGCGN